MNPEKNKFDSEKEFRRMVKRKTVYSFLVFFFCIAFGLYFYIWFTRQPEVAGTIRPLRQAFRFNERFFALSFSDTGLAPEYPKENAVRRVRRNGDVGMDTAFNPSDWKFHVIRFSDRTPMPGDTLLISLNEIKALPKTEVVFNFKCIEGWSQITWWGGVRFSDFAKHYNLGTRDRTVPDPVKNPEAIASYAGLSTPDHEYYVGIDMPSMFHPQTILCYEMNGMPLPLNQGAPLRLIIPVKYGIKHLKRIGTIYFSDTGPPDYWFERGYDYYSGL